MSKKRASTRAHVPTTRTHSLSDATRAPAEALGPALDADLVAIRAGPLLLPHIHIARLEHPALLGIEASLDLGQPAELHGVEEFFGVVDGADVDVLEGGTLHARCDVLGRLGLQL